MNTTTRISTAGRSVGRGWRAFARGERRLSSWLASKGMPMAGVAVLLWVVKLVTLGLLFYVAFWLALLLLLGVAAAWMADNSARKDDRWAQQDELRNGEAGFGLYSSTGQRIDPHDPNDPFDD
ncbi:DUF3742 family protein [Xanthomonas theicola]|uniref:DUF3742 domain-containing protein n=1 Tax=Xanthomonas theicola TaxID=56464 RepID=A0A2S6Z978_9XANT|nr:DUF3742 family protein [Xanthomonas theicola]PPT78525.1 hypothetical protein XthCFBP4691_19175 [Xanthomonas theicola]QNH24272.1 DUF3742 family protein [Xanthomonas theicola]